MICFLLISGCSKNANNKEDALKIELEKSRESIICYKIESEDMKIKCFFDLAIKYNDPSFCGEVCKKELEEKPRQICYDCVERFNTTIYYYTDILFFCNEMTKYAETTCKEENLTRYEYDCVNNFNNLILHDIYKLTASDGSKVLSYCQKGLT